MWETIAKSHHSNKTEERNPIKIFFFFVDKRNNDFLCLTLSRSNVCHRANFAASSVRWKMSVERNKHEIWRQVITQRNCIPWYLFEVFVCGFDFSMRNQFLILVFVDAAVSLFSCIARSRCFTHSMVYQKQYQLIVLVWISFFLFCSLLFSFHTATRQCNQAK